MGLIAYVYGQKHDTGSRENNFFHSTFYQQLPEVAGKAIAGETVFLRSSFRFCSRCLCAYAA